MPDTFPPPAPSPFLPDEELPLGDIHEPGIEHLFTLGTNTVLVGNSDVSDRPVLIQLSSPYESRFQRLTVPDALHVIGALQQVIRNSPKACSMCGRGEDEVAAFYADGTATVRICDGCVMEAAQAIQAALVGGEGSG